MLSLTSYPQTDPIAEEESVVELVNNLLKEAIQKTISDIHIEPYKTHCRIRFRQDGLLHEAMTLTTSIALRLITRLKLMSGLDIAEKRLPQDGRLVLSDASHLHIRVNICPSLWGEKLVLRLQNIEDFNLAIENLGMSDLQQSFFLKKLLQPSGLIVVAGPTGSGKTHTLYAALHHLNSVEKNIVTLEDPIEIELANTTQINIHPKIGLNFASLLRSILRQDPDIIMIGEIRDSDTAKIAFQAAQTGHLVLTTVHANSAAETLTRLQALGIPLADLNSIGPLIISQRLIRCLCPSCKSLIPHKYTIYKSMGCSSCMNGYLKRTGIFDIYPTNRLKNFWRTQRTPQNQQARNNAILKGLWHAGWKKVINGETSIEELLRVLGNPSL